MTLQSLLPKIILRSSSDLVAWDKQQKNTFLKFGPPGDAIRKKQKHDKFTPKLNDMILDHLNQTTTLEGNQHDSFINNIRQSEENFTRDMETIIFPAMMPNNNGSLRGFVKIQHLTAAIYIAGLTGDRFQKKRDEILSTNHLSRLTQSGLRSTRSNNTPYK